MKLPAVVEAELAIVLAVLHCDNLIAKLAAVQAVLLYHSVLAAAVQRLLH